MKKRKKWTPKPLELWNPGAVEQWLEEEAAQGWRLKDSNGWFVKFEAAEKRSCRVRVHPQGPEAREAFLERIAAYEEMGWEYAAALDLDFEIFYCDDPAAPELYTDPVVYGWAWEKQLKRARRNAWLLLLLPLFVRLLPCIMRRSALQTLLAMPAALLIASVVLAPLLTALCIRQLWLIGKLCRKIKAGVKPERNDNWRKDRRWWRLALALLLVYWVVYVLGNAGQVLARPDTFDLPYVAAAELMPGSNTAQWELETYVQRSTPLDVVRFETELSYGEQSRVRNTSDKVRLTALAKALYREKREEFRAEWPEAAETAIENDAFDEAVLLVGGQDTQMLLVRAGKTVYSLWVNFPADLNGKIGDLAAALSK